MRRLDRRAAWGVGREARRPGVSRLTASTACIPRLRLAGDLFLTQV